MSPRLERALRALLLMLLALLVGYGSAEAWLRSTLAFAPKRVFAWPPLQRSVVVVSQALPGLEPRKSVLTTSAAGLRADERSFGRADGVATIMTLGGSVTECYLLGDHDTWPYQLQQRLREKTGRRVWVGNAGRSGQMTLDYTVHAKLLIPQFRPGLVIVMPGGNDVQAAAEQRLLPIDLDDPATLQRYAALLYEPGGDVLERLEPSYVWFHLWRWLTTRHDDYTALYVEMKRRRYQAPKLEAFPDLESDKDVYRTNLARLVKSLRETGSRVLLMTHPYLWKDGMSDEETRALWAGYTCMGCPDAQYYSMAALRGALRAVNQITLETCRANGLACLDLEPRVPKDLTHFYDDAHLKEAGARHVAGVVADFVIQENLLR